MIKNFIFLAVLLQQYSQNVQAECGTTIIATTTTTLAPAVQFAQFQQTFGVVYENEAIAAQKFAVFSSNLDIIAQHNAAAAAGYVTYTLGVNKFADLTSKEFIDKYTGFLLNKTNSLNYKRKRQNDGYQGRFVKDPSALLPDSIDWRDYGYVTPVKFQGSCCNSCWTFSSTGALEGQHKRATGELISLSEQNLLDCTYGPTEGGCDGGNQVDAFMYVYKNKGINSATKYQYKEICAHKCNYNPDFNVETDVIGWKEVIGEDNLKAAVATIGPIAISIDSKYLHLHKNGVFSTNESCSAINHGMLLVGYGTDPKDGDFWIVKNSWGTFWGDKGYIRWARNVRMCQMGTIGYFPIIKPSSTAVKPSSTKTTTTRTTSKTTTSTRTTTTTPTETTTATPTIQIATTNMSTSSALPYSTLLSTSTVFPSSSRLSTSTPLTPLSSTLEHTLPIEQGLMPICNKQFGFSFDSNSVLICNKDSFGNPRNAHEIDCVFPFQYNGTWYDSCTSAGKNYYWCSIDEVYTNRWVRCASRCPQLALLLTKDSSTDMHTSCRDPDPALISSFPPNQTDINKILALHNNVRSSVNPLASSMASISWDWRMARLAQNAANLCNGGDITFYYPKYFWVSPADCYNCRKLLNNNTVSIGQLSNKLFDQSSPNWESAFNSWINNTDNSIAQIITDKLYAIGCGVSKCDNGYVYVCNYATDSYDSSNPYQTGTPCTNCDSCLNNLCNCNKVCQNFGSLNSQTCECECLDYARGEYCEIIVCDQNQNDPCSIELVPQAFQTTPKSTTTTLIPPNPQVLGVCTHGFSIGSNGATICNRDTHGITRSAHEVDCQFPFQYKEVWYDICTNVDRGYYWCSIDTIFSDRYSPCAQECPELARRIVPPESGMIHSSCVKPVDGVYVKRLFPNETEINQILELHNEARSIVDPPAVFMRRLVWDQRLARIAQSWSSSCHDIEKRPHDCSDCRLLLNHPDIRIGQNLFKYFSLFTNLSLAMDIRSFWKKGIQGLLWEKTLFNYGGPPPPEWKGGESRIGHYIQMINDGTYVVGCGGSQCGMDVVVACNYAGPQYDDNVLNPYENGTSCSNCGPAMCSNNLCDCSIHCYNGGQLDRLSCTCKCPKYTNGDFCENLACSLTDAQYGCYFPGNITKCDSGENSPEECPVTCGLCSIKLLNQTYVATTTTTTTTTLAPPGVIGVCNMLFGFDVNSNGDTICKRDSHGLTRNTHEIDCQFPFQYKGVWYDACTNVDRGYYWCSIGW